jgi:hypothetical protein
LYGHGWDWQNYLLAAVAIRLWDVPANDEYHQGFKYGVHSILTHMSLGLLFLGGGRYTLGTSDAVIACMVTAFFP